MLSHEFDRHTQAFSTLGFYCRPSHAYGIDYVRVLSLSTRAGPGIARRNRSAEGSKAQAEYQAVQAWPEQK